MDVSGSDKFSILSPYSDIYDPLEVAAFYQDLNLFQIMDKLTAKWGKNVRRYYRYMPGSREEEAYRRAVYRDVKKDAVYESLIRFTENLEKVAKFRKEKEKVSLTMQRAVWHIREAGAYCETIEILEKDLSKPLGTAV